MAITIMPTGETVTYDESLGLQNATATPSPNFPAEDANDNDIDAALLPTDFTTRLTALGAGTSTEAALSGYNGANNGLDIFTVTAAPGGSVVDIGFTDSSGAALNGLASGLFTLDNNEIFLYTDSANNNILLAREGNGSTADPSGTIVFAAYIDQTTTGGKIWTAHFEKIKHSQSTDPTVDESVDLTNLVYVGVSQELTFSLANAPSGQNLFLMFTTANPTTELVDGIARITSPTIIATGKDPANQSTGVNINTGDTINTSQAGGPTTFGTNNQMITEQEGIRFTFVTGARQDVTIPNLDQNEADVEANIDFTGLFSARSAIFDVVQLQSGKSAIVKVSALSTALEPGVNFIDGYSNDTAVAITNVRVLSSTGQVIENSDGSVNSPSISISIVAGVATISGVVAGQKIEYTTTSDHNRVLVENGAAVDAKGNNHADFDIGGVKLLNVSTAATEIGSKMFIEDDGPSIAQGDPSNDNEPAIVDETDLATDTSADFSIYFPPPLAEPGADGVASVTSAYALSVSSSGAESGLVDVATGNSVFLFLNASGVVEGREGTDAVDAETGEIVFTVSVIESGIGAGTITLDQQRAVVHDDSNDPDESTSPAMLASPELIRLTRTDTIIDRDGDIATDSSFINIADDLIFQDDGPSIEANAEPTPTLTVDETNLNTTASASFAGLFTAPLFGNDGFKDADDNDIQDDDALSYSLGVSAPDADSGLVDTLSGDAVLLNKVGNDIVGTAGGFEVFRISVDASGQVTLDQSRAVVHDDPNDHDEATSPAMLASADLITLTATVIDGDGDSDSAVRNIGDAFKFEDDGPTEFSPDSVTLTNTGTAVATGDLDTTSTDSPWLPTRVGADQPGMIEFVDNYPDDDYLRDTNGNILKSDDVNIVLEGFGTGTLTAKTEGTNLTVFTATLDAVNGEYTIDFDRKIDDGSGVSFLGAAPVRSGNPAYNLINDVGGTSLDILFSGTIPGTTTVNVSTQGAGTGNQTMNPGETLRLDVVTGGALAGSPNGSDFNYTAHSTVNGFSFLLTQNTPSGTTGTLYVKAYDADDDKILAGDADDTVDPITMLKINDQEIVFGNTYTINGHSVTAFLHDNGVVITGLNEGNTGDGAGGDDPEILVYTADGFNRVEITNFSGQTVNGQLLAGTDFDIAPAGFEQTEQGTPFSYQLPVQITDGDGDFTPIELIGVNVNPV
ncbi:DUF5801 repeats-in-toxin domain-containing protein [Nitrosomonas sp.]|uniref:DUF5801 repeats-in-toxin domain-containing protein n=1 Tax=Nitrosomonas sp. TaxID=42353 RepID=UPI002634B2D7|nr:DUF5801 repeats-in-toxin domain-containing protein [Nitrosomonas sp.]MCW5601487.1 hypothetical protein [Nitrosomonas sp.]